MFKGPNRDKLSPGVIRAQNELSVECTVSWSPEWISCSVFQCLISGDGDLLSETVQVGCLSSGVYRSSKLSGTARPFYSYWCIYSISISSFSPARSAFVLSSSKKSIMLPTLTVETSSVTALTVKSWRTMHTLHFF